MIGRQDWYEVGGGESGYISPDPRDPDIVYAGSDAAIITRYDHRTDQLTGRLALPARHLRQRRGRSEIPLPVDRAGDGVALRLQRHLQRFAVCDEEQLTSGHSWNAISPDLTRNDKSKQKPSGGDITLDITSVEYYDTVFTLAESPLQKGMLWAGTDDGLIHLTRDDGKNWENVTPKDMPEWSMVSIIEASHFDAGTAYAAVDRTSSTTSTPLIYKTHDYGKTWTRITNGIPAGAYARAVREDPKVKGLLYAGTETGVYFSIDDGAHWQSLQLNLPTSPGARSRRERQRSHCRDAWPLVLDS